MARRCSIYSGAGLNAPCSIYNMSMLNWNESILLIELVIMILLRPNTLNEK